MLGEIESYYGGTDVPGDVDQIRAVLFGERPMATVLLAREGDEVLGLASFSFLWPAAGAEASVFFEGAVRTGPVPAARRGPGVDWPRCGRGDSRRVPAGRVDC